MCVCVWPACLPEYRVHAWCQQRPEQIVDPLGLELLTAVSYHVSAENRTSAERVLLTAESPPQPQGYH